MVSTQAYYLKEEVQRILQKNNESANVRFKTSKHHDLTIYIYQFDEISSTMMFSEQWKNEYVDDKSAFLFIAKKQSKGRGQRQNQWNSPLGNIYMTLLSKENSSILSFASIITTITVKQILQETVKLTDEIKLKWVNDMVLTDKKVGGVLVKVNNILKDSSYLQVGIGVNVHTSPMATSTCLQEHSKTQIDQNKMDEIMLKISQRLLDYFRNFNVKDLLQKYNENLLFQKQHVKIYNFELTQVTHEGTFLGVDDHGFAILQTNDGKKIVVSNGRMRSQ